MKNISCFFFLLCSLSISCIAQEQYKVLSVGFYNLENLFDTVNDTTINDEDFLPNGSNAWTEEKYVEKQANMAYAVSQIALDHTKSGLSVIGVCEIENRKVLEDLVKQPTLKSRNYQIVHYDSPDRRGVDVSLLYNPAHFTLLSSKSMPLLIFEDGNREYTRDILYVKGLFDGDTIHFMVNHWPSRRGGEEASAYKRIKGAQLCQAVIDSLAKSNPLTKVIVMGDLNDDPTSISVKNYMPTKFKESDVKIGDVFNPMGDFYRRGIGSTAYRDSWSLFDQLIFSYGLLAPQSKGFHYHKAFIFNKSFLVQNFGQYKGYPFRTFSGNNYQGGYSDHFPSYALLIKKIGN